MRCRINKEFFIEEIVHFTLTTTKHKIITLESDKFTLESIKRMEGEMSSSTVAWRTSRLI